MKKHIASIHNKDQVFKCELCNFCFKTKGSLKRHVSRTHEGQKPFECKLCNQRFTENSSLKSHNERLNPKFSSQK